MNNQNEIEMKNSNDVNKLIEIENEKSRKLIELQRRYVLGGRRIDQ